MAELSLFLFIAVDVPLEFLQMLKTKYRLAFPDLPPDESFNMYDLADYAKLYGVED